ncbi:MAG TPA: HAMP domain-containing histidine kinase [Candidatus Anaerobutyricum stercoris]|uniref:histidine kinase n=2 Tax=Clostridia TaxID=186801 RepID=A0A9D2EL10_9FIRM|nr:two-component sensor histidine kinase [Eubacterium sp. An3]HIZ39462.1 HAMP domain-containing histidine kinase [Candidatus Anaerobutyricum stercoris]
MVRSYQKKAEEQKASYVEKQCGILANQLVLNGISAYDMTKTSDDRGSNFFEMEQLANDIDGRILIIDNHFEILADTYNKNNGQYYVTDDLIRAFEGEDVSYTFAGTYIQVISGVYNQDTGEIEAVVMALSSMDSIEEMIGYLYEQRATLTGLFFLITLIVMVLLVIFMRKSFRNMQNELDIIAEGHQEESMSESGFKEFNRMAVSFNKIVNRYKELENTRQEFVSNVSHELKTPITSMKILADSLLMQENVPVEIYEDFMNDIVHEIDRENQIINDLLTLVKMDKTQADLNISPTNINELLEVLLKRISPIAEQRNITIRLETMRQVVAEVDEVKLSLACNNIIENAVKYNHDGGKVDVSLNGDHKFFYIRVKDTGVGIPEDCQEQIFERFYRVDKARSRETGGTGLGLAISRNVILLHKGSIRVHSKEGEGTTFIIRIPLNYLG